jgi:hypothetical protein
MRAKAAVAAEVSRPTWNVVARSTTTAVSGRASWVIAEPSSLTVWPLHSSMNPRLRQREPARPDPATGSMPGSMPDSAPDPMPDSAPDPMPDSPAMPISLVDPDR